MVNVINCFVISIKNNMK